MADVIAISCAAQSLASMSTVEVLEAFTLRNLVIQCAELAELDVAVVKVHKDLIEKIIAQEVASRKARANTSLSAQTSVAPALARLKTPASSTAEVAGGSPQPSALKSREVNVQATGTKGKR